MTKLNYAAIITLTALLTLAGCAANGPHRPQTESTATQPPQTTALSCPDARYSKAIMLTHVWIPAPPQDIVHLGTSISTAIATDLRATGHFRVETTLATRSTSSVPATDSFTSKGSPFFVQISGQDFGLSGQASKWSFLGPSLKPRGGTLNLRIINALTTQVMAQTSLGVSPVKTGEYDPVIDALGTEFLTSAYGKAMNKLAAEAAEWIDQILGCKPLIGQVVKVEGATITINRGIKDGLRSSDRFVILQRTAPLYQPGQNPFEEKYLLQSLGVADVARLGEQTTQIHYSGSHIVQVGDIVQSSN